MLDSVRAVITFGCSTLVGVDVKRIIGASLHARLAPYAPLIIEIDNPIGSCEKSRGRTDSRTWRVLAMIASMDAELSGRIGIRTLFDVLDMCPIYSDRDIMLRLAGYGASMAPDASLVVYHESVVRHNLCDEESTQNGWRQPRSIPRMAPPASQAPAIEPRFPIAVTIRTLPTRFFQNRDTSSRTRKSWASLPVGDATFNCV